MSQSERMSPVDAAWLRMDRPGNLMMIVGIWLLEGPVAIDKVEKQIVEGVLSYRRYHQKAEYSATGPWWRDDPNFDLSHHVKRVRLPGRGDKTALERFVGELASEPLDPNRPLWTVHLVEGYEHGAAVLFRLHHAMADGHALTRVTMSVVDGPARKNRGEPSADEGKGWLQALAAPVVSTIGAGVEASSAILGGGLDFVRHPLRAVDVLRDGAGVAGELAYLLAMPSDSPTRFKGKPGGAKRVAWCEPLKLSEVKAVAHALGCSINDLLLSCVAGAMRRYLVDKGDRTEGLEVRAIVPIDLREAEDSGLGNGFGMLAVELPVGVAHPIARLMTVRERMLALKASYEPATTLGLFAALGYGPKVVQDQLLDLLASRASAVITNVPGPAEPLTVAGSRLKQNLGWVPQSGDIGIGVSICSYAGQVQFGVITDAALTPDPEALVSRFPEEFGTYLYSMLLASPPSKAEAPGRLASPVQPESRVETPSRARSAPARRAPPARKPANRGKRGQKDHESEGSRSRPRRPQRRSG